MKVLFQSRLDLFKQRGGDTVQMLETKAALEKLGVSVDINSKINMDLSGYDLIHVFNLDWVCEAYLQISNARKWGKKVVLSPIHHSQKEFERYENSNRYGLMRLGNALIKDQARRDEVRNLIKGLLYPQKLKPTLSQIFMGIRTQQRLSLLNCDYVLVQTTLEAEDLKRDFNVPSFKWSKVVNGINKDIFGGIERGRNKEKCILCVGRIEPRKNQLNLIKAFEELGGSDVKLIFVGALNNHHPTYLRDFMKKVNTSGGDIIYKGFVDQKDLCSLYFESLVFAVPSWFETTGLVYLEAAVCGISSIVASGARAKEYLGSNANYCDPGDIVSIRDNLRAALNEPTVKKGFSDFVRRTYTWDNCAKQTLEVYKEILR